MLRPRPSESPIECDGGKEIDQSLSFCQYRAITLARSLALCLCSYCIPSSISTGAKGIAPWSGVECWTDRQTDSHSFLAFIWKMKIPCSPRQPYVDSLAALSLHYLIMALCFACLRDRIANCLIALGQSVWIDRYIVCRSSTARPNYSFSLPTVTEIGKRSVCLVD